MAVGVGFTVLRVFRLSRGQPYRAGPEAAEGGPKRAPKDPIGMVPGVVPERLSFRASESAAGFRSSHIGLSA